MGQCQGTNASNSAVKVGHVVLILQDDLKGVGWLSFEKGLVSG